MRVGTIAYSCDMGLGYLAKSFYDHGVVDNILVVEHSSRPTHKEWYPKRFNVVDIGRLAQSDELRRFCEACDVVLFFETPFHWPIIDHCRAKGIKTALIVMYECTHEKIKRHKPDLLLCPSLMDLDYAKEWNSNCLYLPVPVEVEWRQRTKAEVFVHNAGNGGLRGRNGTRELLQAMRLVKSPAKLILRSQERNDWPPYPELLGKVTLTEGTVPADQLYSEGDVFVFAEKFNGLSLPLQEARASGMLVMATDRYPVNTWLPTAPLIPPSGYLKNIQIGPPYPCFNESIVDPKIIANKIDEWYGKDIIEYSLQGREWAKRMSWEVLKPKYMEALRAL